MEFKRVVARRRMVRRFTGAPIEPDVLDRIVTSGLRGPSAGFAQGLDLVVLDTPETVSRFWDLADPRGRKRPPPGSEPAAIVLVLSDPTAYLARYSEPDKAGLGMDELEAWPVPFWDVDAGMAALLILLSAVDEGVGAWFFGVFSGDDDIRAWLEIPEGRRTVGAIALGLPHPEEGPSGSASTRPRREASQAIHRGFWGGPVQSP